MGNLCGGLRGAIKNEFKFIFKSVNFRFVQANIADVEVATIFNAGEKPSETPLRTEATKLQKPAQGQVVDPKAPAPAVVTPKELLELQPNTVFDEAVDTFKNTKHLLSFIYKFTDVLATDKTALQAAITTALKWSDDKNYAQVGLPEALFNLKVDKKEQVEAAITAVEQYASARVKAEPLEVLFVVSNDDLAKFFEEIMKATDTRLNPKPVVTPPPAPADPKKQGTELADKSGDKAGDHVEKH